MPVVFRQKVEALWQVQTACSKNSKWSVCLEQTERGDVGKTKDEARELAGGQCMLVLGGHDRAWGFTLSAIETDYNI